MFGDEVGALVLDIGTVNSRVGFAGDDTPKAFFPSVAGVVPQSGTDKAKSSRYLVGNTKPFMHREHQEIKSALKNGLVDDWDVYEELLGYAFHSHLSVNPTEHPLMISEPSFNTPDLREKLLEIAFEQFQVPAVFLCKDACLASFSVGKASALVVDIGGGKTSVAPVLDGHILNKGLKHTKVSANTLDILLEKSLFTDNKMDLVPRYKVKRSLDAKGNINVRGLTLNHTTQSYDKYMRQVLLHDIKAGVCQVAQTEFQTRHNTNMPSVTWELPDGKKIEVGPERFAVPEFLIRPEVPLQPLIGDDFYDMGRGSERTRCVFEGLPKLISDSVESVDVDVRKELYSNIVVTGGGALLPHINSRLLNELSAHTPPAYRVKLHSEKATTQERLFGTWTGGSILGSLGSFHQMWFSKAEYEDSGEKIGAVLAQRFP